MTLRRLAVLTCQLRKSESEKHTLEVATEQLLQFAEVLMLTLDLLKSILIKFILNFVLKPKIHTAIMYLDKPAL